MFTYGDMRTATVIVIILLYWSYFRSLELYHYSNRVNMVDRGKTCHVRVAVLSICCYSIRTWVRKTVLSSFQLLIITSGSSTASGPNTVNVFPEPDKPYANNTTALPVSRSALIFFPTEEYT